MSYKSKVEGFINNERNKILAKIDSAFANPNTGGEENEMLIGQNPMFKLEDIPPELVDFFYDMDVEVDNKINTIFFGPNFDGNNGYVIMFEEDTPLTDKIFNRLNIGVCTAVYDVKSGKPGHVSKSNLKIMKNLVSSKGSGPHISRRNGKDVISWTQKLNKDDWINLGFSKDGKMKLVVRSSVRGCNSELSKLISKVISEKSGYLLKDLVMPGGSLYPYYTSLLESSLRNNKRVAWEATRFFKVRISDDEDSKAVISNPSVETLPKIGVPSIIQMSNVFEYKKGLDMKDYKSYTCALQVKDYKYGLYKKDIGGKNCIVYHQGCSPNPYYRTQDLPQSYEHKEFAYFLLMVSKKTKKMYIAKLNPKVKTARWITFPDFYVPHHHRHKKERRMIKIKEEEEKEGGGVMVREIEEEEEEDKCKQIVKFTYIPKYTDKVEKGIKESKKTEERESKPENLYSVQKVTFTDKDQVVIDYQDRTGIFERNISDSMIPGHPAKGFELFNPLCTIEIK